MWYYLSGVIVMLLFTGCEINPPSKNYKAFVKKYGNSSRFYCDKSTGFFMKEYYWKSRNTLPTLRVMKNDLEQPIRCGEAFIKVLETSQGTERIF